MGHCFLHGGGMPGPPPRHALKAANACARRDTRVPAHWHVTLVPCDMRRISAERNECQIFIEKKWVYQIFIYVE
jgi:hypothetical protein